MLSQTNTTDAATIDYARSHDIVRLSAKRYEQSPYLERFITDDAVFGLYANRFYPLSLGGDAVADYWKLRKEVMLYDVPEKPISIKGPDAAALVEKLFTRKVGRLKRWRARYALACTPQGTILMDGVLIRLAKDHFWYVKANGEFESWLMAFSYGMDVTISDPRSWVLQVQGPHSMRVLDAATDGPLPEKFGYFHAGMFSFDGQMHLVTRTGWTGEMGFEIYSNEQTDHLALWDHLMRCGKPFGIGFGSLESMGLRRIESGILDNGTDIDPTMTPFEAGLGAFVDFSKAAFIGRKALESADRRQLLFGLTSVTGVPSAGFDVLLGEKTVGRITAGSWSPTLEKGIGYVRFYAPSAETAGWLGQTVTLKDSNGNLHPANVVNLPFYDEEKLIPRGLATG
ncbi:MAG: aminomethyltransferase family protein [Candidatus Promineifilaceae bacterium]